jgi:hypothetical protein
MTEAQAHEFLSKCRRYLLWSKDVVSLTSLRRKCISLISILSVLLGISLPGSLNGNGGWFHFTGAVFCIVGISFSIWILIRLRQARIALKLPAWHDLKFTFSSAPAPK